MVTRNFERDRVCPNLLDIVPKHKYHIPFYQFDLPTSTTNTVAAFRGLPFLQMFSNVEGASYNKVFEYCNKGVSYNASFPANMLMQTDISGNGKFQGEYMILFTLFSYRPVPVQIYDVDRRLVVTDPIYIKEIMGLDDKYMTTWSALVSDMPTTFDGSTTNHEIRRYMDERMLDSNLDLDITLFARSPEVHMPMAQARFGNRIYNKSMKLTKRDYEGKL